MNAALSDTAECVSVEVAPDLLTAFLNLGPTSTTDSPAEADVFDALEDAEVVIDDAVRARVAEFLRLVSTGEAGSDPFIVAQGEPPQHGQNAKFIWDEHFAKEATDWQDDASVNYYTLNSILTVDQDTMIGTIAPAVQPRNGVDVKGEQIPAEGSALPLQIHESVRQSPDDPNRVISNRAGKVTDDGQVLQIVEVLKIKGDVGFDTGNVDSTIEVYITGRVPDRFEVKSAGSITVVMAIEAAKVTAGGDVVVRRGILGRGSGLVTAAGEIIAKFGANANLIAAGDIKIGKQLMNCHVCVGGKLIAAGASVIGGSLYSRDGLEVTHLGSEANVPTRIVVDVRPEVIREVAVIDKRVKRVRQLIDRIRELVQPLLDREEPLSGAHGQQASDLLSATSNAAAMTAEDEKRREELLKNAYGDGTAHVRVSGKTNQGVTIRIGDRETTFRRELKGPVTFEKRKIKNVTELVAVNTVSGSIKILRSERRTGDELMDGFELEQEIGQSRPIATRDSNPRSE